MATSLIIMAGASMGASYKATELATQSRQSACLASRSPGGSMSGRFVLLDLNLLHPAGRDSVLIALTKKRCESIYAYHKQTLV